MDGGSLSKARLARMRAVMAAHVDQGPAPGRDGYRSSRAARAMTSAIQATARGLPTTTS